MNRRIIGGLTAGLVLTVLNVIAQLVLGDRVQHDMDAWLPGATERMSAGATAIAAGVLMKLVIGILLVSLYAVLRSRGTSGPRAASYAAIFVWLLGAIFFSDFVMLGMISGATYALLEALQLASFLIASWTGAAVYSGRRSPPSQVA